MQLQGVSPTPRVLDLIDVVASSFMAANGLSMSQLSDALAPILLDISQSHSRKAFSHGGLHKCLTTSSTLYSFKLERVILPQEMLKWQGYPATLKVPDECTQTDLRDFCGEGMFLPSLATCLWALLWNVKLGSTNVDQ